MKFFDVGENTKCKFNGNRLCTPEPDKPKLSCASLLEEEDDMKDKEDTADLTRINTDNEEQKEPFIEVVADKYSWTWILFDKRVEYECNPVIDGSSVAFKMDIDVWKKTIKEIKQNEESQSMMNDILSGHLNVDMNEIDEMENDKIPGYYRQNTAASSSASPTQSANLVFNPYRDEIVEYVLNPNSS